MTVLGGYRAGSLAALDGIAFVAQDTPLYKNLSAADLLHVTRNLNRRFDQNYAEQRLGELGIPLRQKAGKMSGGQQAQLALTLALARRPRLLVLDEPMAMLDPIARHDFMATVMTAVADDGVSVVLSSHVLSELERVADYLVLVSHGSVQMVGEVDDLLATHRVLTGPASESERYRAAVERRAREPCRIASTPAGPLRRRLRSGATGMGGAPGHPRRTDPGLPARAQRRRAARPDPRPRAEAIGDAEMTAVTMPVPARAEDDASLRPLPWRRMAWVTWRHHRIALSGVIALLGALALWLYIAGLQLHHAYAAAAACHPASSSACLNQIVTFEGTNLVLKYALVLQPVPALIGAFIGAPLLAREMETGTFRYAWTQGFGRWRWALAKLVMVGVAVTVVAGAFSVLVSWYYQPYVAAGNRARIFRAQRAFSWPVRCARGRLCRLDARRLRYRRPGWHAHPPGRPCHRCHPRRLLRSRPDSRKPAAAALHGGAGREERQHTRVSVDQQRVVDQGRQVRLRRSGPIQPPPPAVPFVFQGWPRRRRSRCRHGFLQSRFSHPGAVPHPTRLHPMGQLRAGQPLLAVPMDRGGLVARAVAAAHRRNRLARPPSSSMNRSGVRAKMRKRGHPSVESR